MWITELGEKPFWVVDAIDTKIETVDTIVVVTDLAMVEKLSSSGDLLVYAVDRKSGEPRANTQIEIVRERNTIASGRTNNEGIFQTKIPTLEDADPTGEEVNKTNFVILGSQQDNFAISDLDSFYFSNFGERDEHLQGYIYTDRPVYRPNHKVYFKGILRGFDEHRQYRTIKAEKVFVSVKDPNDARVFEQELQLSQRGTFNGEFTLAEEAPLGTYRVETETEEGSSTGFAGEKPLNLASTKLSYQLADFKNESEPVQPTIRKDTFPAARHKLLSSIEKVVRFQRRIKFVL